MQRLHFPVEIPFAELLGLELWGLDEGQAELRLELQPAHLNSRSVAHGGVVMTLLDVAMAHAARGSQTYEPGQRPSMVTIEMKTSFMRPAQGRLKAVGRLLHRTATMAFTEASVFDEHSRICAHSTGTFKYLRPAPTALHNVPNEESP